MFSTESRNLTAQEKRKQVKKKKKMANMVGRKQGKEEEYQDRVTEENVCIDWYNATANI